MKLDLTSPTILDHEAVAFAWQQPTDPTGCHPSGSLLRNLDDLTLGSARTKSLADPEKLVGFL